MTLDVCLLPQSGSHLRRRARRQEPAHGHGLAARYRARDVLVGITVVTAVVHLAAALVIFGVILVIEAMTRR